MNYFAEEKKLREMGVSEGAARWYQIPKAIIQNWRNKQSAVAVCKNHHIMRVFQVGCVCGSITLMESIFVSF